ncbi:MAG: hypothetical protein IKL89_04560 [Clostridia bacterium]|nr:hypothetical protein [Clostridia bacterium]
MKTPTHWSYAPYRPPFIDVGDIYICRVAPEPDAIVFDWLPAGAEGYRVYFRRRGAGDFSLAGETGACTFRLCGLIENAEYEFYVAAGEKKSRIRLARCAASVGRVVNYLHPEDEAYAFSGRYLCSPSLVRLPDGALLASMDLFAGAHPQNLTLIYRSDDDGRSWRYVSELFPCFWGKLFVHAGALYMLSVSTEYGDLLIGRSDDGGRTFTRPVTLLYGGGGKNGEAGVHKNPQPVVTYAGRIWNTLEWGAWGRKYHAPMVMSAPVYADLLDPGAWSFSEPVKYDPSWPGVAEGPSTGNIEGCLVPLSDGLYNIMRYDMTKTTPNWGRAVCYRVDCENPEAPLAYARCIEFPANHSKFIIRYHEGRKMYYSVASRISAEAPGRRNLLSLLRSPDGIHWELDRDIYDYTHEDPAKIGFQYVDFFIEGDEILLLCRTAMAGAHNFHDSNFSTFDRIQL